MTDYGYIYYAFCSAFLWLNLDSFKHLFLTLITLFVFAEILPGKDQSILPLDHSWQYRFGESSIDEDDNLIWLNNDFDSAGWINIKKLDEIPRDEAGRTLWLRTILPDSNITNPAVFIENVMQVVQVYVEGELVYEYGNFDPNDETIPLGYTVHLVPLPKDFQNKTLTLRIYSSIKSLGFYQFPVLGSFFNITKGMLTKSMDKLVLTLISLICGVFLFLSFPFTKQRKLFLGLSITLLSVGLWTGSNIQLLQLIFPYPYLFYVFDNISVFSFAIGPFYILEQIIDDKYKKIVSRLWQANVLYLVISIIVEFLPGFDFWMIFDYYLIVFVVISVIGIYVMILSVHKGNYQTRLILIGFIFMFFCGILEVLIYYNGDGAYTPVLIHFGSLALVVMLSFVLIYEFKSTRKQKELAQRLALEAVNKEKETRRVFTQRLITAQEDERKRISFELHDAVGQDLLVIKNMTRLVQKNVNDLHSAEEFLNDISSAADNSIKDVRDISRTLHPYQLGKLGLTAALKSLILKVENSTEIKISSNIDNVDNAFEQSQEIHIFRILQECLNNVIKHSGASNVEVSICRNADEVSVSVKDDGRGFEISNNEDSAKYGIGITGINERVQILNGTLDITSKIGEGTEVKVSIGTSV